MKYIYILCIVFWMSACKMNQKQLVVDNDDTITIIDLSKNVSEVKSLFISDAVSKIEVVSLEVTDNSMLGDIDKLQVTANDIWIKAYSSEYIYRFSRSGKFLNLVGKIGQGPEEYTRLSNFYIDEDKKEICIVSTVSGVKGYNFNGEFKRRVTNQPIDKIFNSNKIQFIPYHQLLFLSQNLYITRPISNPKDSLWSIALVDSIFHKEKIFKNPAHTGREEDIVMNRAKPTGFVNYWEEFRSVFDTYNNELTLKYPDTDTIFRYNIEMKEFTPLYSINTGEEEGDYEFTHLWIKDRKAFDYFTITGYYQTQEYIYLVGNKGEDICVYRYGKSDRIVKKQIRKGHIIARKLPWSTNPHLFLGRSFVLKNDVIGGDFTVDFCSNGKYWIDMLDVNNNEYKNYLNEVKNSSVKDTIGRDKFINILENLDDESNPILLIATLK